MAQDPGLGTRSPGEHPYPFCFVFLKQIQSLTKELRHFKHNLFVAQLQSPWLEGQCLPSPKLGSAAEVSLFPCVWSALTNSLLPSPAGCTQVPWSHCGSESNVTGPGCSVLPPPCKGPISAEGCHHRGSLGKRVRGGQCVKGEKNVEIWAANLQGHLRLTGITSTFWSCVVGPVAGDWQNQVCSRVIKLQPGVCG